MAKFREFYVQPGAGGNFLAGKCLWTSESKDRESRASNSVNEFFFHRCRSDSNVIAVGKQHKDIDFEPESIHSNVLVVNEEEFKNLIVETKRIKPILIELDKVIIDMSHTSTVAGSEVSGNPNRDVVINNINYLWREDWSTFTIAFFHLLYWETTPISRHVQYLKKSAQDYFAMCREYYFKVCDRNDWDVHTILHAHPYDTISPRLKLPTTFKSLAMEIDAEMDLYLRHLLSIKHDHAYIKEDWGKILTTAWGRARYNKLSEKTTDLFVNRSVSFSDDSVSYRKIFLENDADEIRKMYKFFDNEDYFDVNRTSIMKEFKEYHDNNMIVLKQFTPLLYKQMKYGKL